MNYIIEIREFYDWLESNDLSTSAISLWHALMNTANRARWPEHFSVAISTLKSKTGCSKDAIYMARNQLKQKGRIRFSERSGNQSAVYVLVPFAPDGVSEFPAQSAIHTPTPERKTKKGASGKTMQTPAQASAQDEKGVLCASGKTTQSPTLDSTQWSAQSSTITKQDKTKTKTKQEYSPIVPKVLMGTDVELDVLQSECSTGIIKQPSRLASLEDAMTTQESLTECPVDIMNQPQKLAAVVGSKTMGESSTECPVDIMNQPQKLASVVGSKTFEERFNLFWQAYPKKVGKGDAQRRFLRIKPDQDLLNTMLSAISTAKRSSQWLKDNGQYIPNPSTWLSQRRWEDELEINLSAEPPKQLNQTDSGRFLW